MDVSVVLLTWNSAADIEVCLRSLLEQKELSKEIIVIDNGSKDKTLETIAEKIGPHPELRIIANKINRGVAAARNQGYDMARGKYVFFVDSDTKLFPQSLVNLFYAMEEHPELGVCGAKMVDQNGRLQYTCRKFPNIISKIIYRQLPAKLSSKLLYREEMCDWDHQEFRYVEYVIGASQIINRRLVDKIGLFDKNMFYGVEDMDLCYRAWQNGFKVGYQPKSIIVHYEQRKGGKFKIFSRLYWIHMINLFKYFIKHKCFLGVSKKIRRD